MSPATPVRILVVDDSPEFLEAMARYLGEQPWAEVIGEARGGVEAVRRAGELRPELVLMDMVMPQVGGLEATRQIKAQVGAPRVVLVSVHDFSDYREYAARAGADGFIAKGRLQIELPPLIGGWWPDAGPQAGAGRKGDAPVAFPAVREALAASGIGVFDWRLTASVCWSEECARLLGLAPGRRGGSAGEFLATLHPDDRAALERVAGAAGRSRGSFRHTARLLRPGRDAGWVAFSGCAVEGEDGEPRLTGLVAEVTDYKRVEAALRENETLLNAIIEAEPACVKLLDGEGTVLQMNPAGLALLQADCPARVVGRPATEWIAPEHRRAFLEFTHSVLDGNRGSLEFEAIGAGNRRVWLESHAMPLTDPQGGAPRLLAVTRDVTERHQAAERLRQLAHYDMLTGLPNRALFLDRLQQAMIEAERHGRLAAVVLLDIDRFKTINDSLGHDLGDVLLKAVAGRLAGTLRTSDTVAHISGDEFCLLLADIAHADDVPQVVGKIMGVFRDPFVVEGRQLHLGASLGVTVFPHDDGDARALLRNADIAMYRAKEQGGHGYQFYAAEMTAKAQETLAMEHALRDAIANGELSLHYQPQFSLISGQLLGVEALLRWNHPQLGAVPPSRFIPIAEETGLIVPIGEWVLRAACAQAAVWRRAGHAGLGIAVNVSSSQFRQPDIAGVIGRILAETGLAPGALEIELTESLLLRNVDATVATLGALHRLGVRFAVDDFGTGYSSLSYLRRFPIDVLKIDQSFVRDIGADADDAAIVDAIITMAHSLGIGTIAEGVETREQLDYLRGRGCDVAQGYYCARPVPAADIDRLLAGPASLDL